MASLFSMAMELVPRRTQPNDLTDCTISTCDISSSYYYYRVSLGANVAFLVLFSLSLLGFIATYAFTRRATAFTFAMVAGVILEVIGYVGRIESHDNQWVQLGFLMQIVCLTIAPAFLAGGLYLSLRRIVYAFGPENSRISPEAYTRIAAGGGLASGAAHSNKSPATGNALMITGLAFQVFTLAIFIILCLDFALRTRKRYRSLGEQALDQDPLFIKLRHSWIFKGFLVALALATICIFWRSVYRVVELSEGWTGDLIRHQNLFIAFEGVMVIVACFSLNAFNPAFAFKEAMEGKGGLGTKKKQSKLQQEREKAVSGSNSDVEAHHGEPLKV